MLDEKKIRQDFPMLINAIKMQNNPLIFLDNASTTFKPQCVLDSMNEYYTTYTANSHRGDYDLCFKVDTKIEEVRKKVTSFINAKENEVVFTSGTTMSINMISNGYFRYKLNKGDIILLDENEHASNVLPWFNLAHDLDLHIEYIPLNERGEITIENLRKSLKKEVKVVSLAAISNVLGNEINVKEFAKVIHDNGSLFVVDGAQSVPHRKTDFVDSDADFLVFSAHKMLGPTGVGCLVGKYQLLEEMNPMISGGGNNIDFKKEKEVIFLNPPQRFESGTLNIAGIIGFGAAIDYLTKIGMDEIEAHEKMLKEYAIKRLKDVSDIVVYNPDSKAGIITFNRKGVFAQDEATLLNYKGVAVRSGLHCAKLLPYFLNENATVRASFYLYTSKEDIDQFVEILKEGGDILDAYFN